jgi:class 3 adenylate cyclase
VVERRGKEIGSLDGDILGTLILGALAATPQVTSIGHVLPELSMCRYNRGDFGRYNEDPSRVPDVSEILAKAQTDTEPQWLAAAWSPILHETILRLVAPLRRPDGEALGIAIAAVTTSAISRYLKNLYEQGGPMAFILAGRDRVVAHPQMASSETTMEMNSGDPLPTIDAIGDPVIAKIWSAEHFPLSALAPFRRAEGHWTAVGSKSYVFVYRTIAGYGDQPWTVGVYFPSGETRRERWVVWGIAIGGSALLCLALAAAVIIGRRLGRPIVGLASVAERIEDLDFEGVQDLPRGPIREVNRAASAFESMAARLRLFETYVPRTLVRRLIAAGSERQESEVRDLTIMFTDLEGYSAFSAGRPATEIADYLNSVLACIGPAVEASGGTIGNFMGDGVMAFWGAPDTRGDQADTACRVALQIAHAVSRLNSARQIDGSPACRLRIGVHTGPAVVRNIGFTGRVQYTIIGEAVNIAQKIEQLGRRADKNAEVTILVSEATRNATEQLFRFDPEICRIEGRIHLDIPVYRLTSIDGYCQPNMNE